MLWVVRLFTFQWQQVKGLYFLLGPGFVQHHHEAVVKFDKIKNRIDSIISVIYTIEWQQTFIHIY